MSTAGQTRRADRRARRKERRGGRKEKRQDRRADRRERRAARQEAGTGIRGRIRDWREGRDDAPADPKISPGMGPGAKISLGSPGVKIPGPGAGQYGDWAGTPDAGGTVATMNGGDTAAAWWADPKILILGAAALFILLRKK